MERFQLEKIKSSAEEFFKKACFEVELATELSQGNTVSIKIKTDDPKVLIGQSGRTLAEVQGLLKSILRKKLSEDFYLDLDVNDYKKKKIEYLKETAREAADEVSLTGLQKTLPPMSSYERRIVHMELSARAGIATESAGFDPDRRIIIKPSLT